MTSALINERFANGRAFQDKIHLECINLNSNIEEVVKHMSTLLYNNYTILRTSPNKNRKKTAPWWNTTVHEVISRSFPNGCRESIVIPVPKGSNDFRPISLTNCLRKVMVKMDSNRLEKNFDYQSIPSLISMPENGTG